MMYAIQLDMYQAAAVAALVLLLGRFLVRNLDLLRRYCIPEPVAGGVVFALAHLALRQAGILEISFDSTLQTFFMVVFFCSVGFTACFRLLKKGGLQVLLFLGIAVMMCVLQNGLGAFIASAFGLDPRLGLATGSIPMVGGHGTAASFGPLLEKAGVSGASAVAIASATFGLVAGCVIGGPTAVSRIRQKNLHSFETATGSNEVVVDKNEVTGAIDSGRFLNAALCLALAIGAGTVVSAWLNKVFTFPIYIGAMLVAAFIRNTTDMAGKEIPMEEISTIGSFSLSLFLGLAMMGLKLWELADLAVPMVVMLVAQTVLMMVYAYFVVFNLLGKNYDAAVMTSGFCGFGMGATPNAMANMQAITQKYGPAPTAYFVVGKPVHRLHEHDHHHQLLKPPVIPSAGAFPII